MEKFISYFFEGYNFQKQAMWFKYALYLTVIISACYWLSYYDMLFGQHAITFSTPGEFKGFRDLAFILYNSPSLNLSAYFITGAGMLSILAMVIPYAYIVIDLLIWFLVVNIHNKIYPTLTGGDFLLNQFLFFNCFLAYKFDEGSGTGRQLKICLHNFASLAVIVQVCAVYFISAVLKLKDESWMSGTAVESVSAIRHFSMFSFPGRDSNAGFLYSAATYLVLIYQLFFPALIWFRPVKIPLLWLGVIIHLYIGLVMGLLSFGLIMIIGYIFFYPIKINKTPLQTASVFFKHFR